MTAGPVPSRFCGTSMPNSASRSVLGEPGPVLLGSPRAPLPCFGACCAVHHPAVSHPLAAKEADPS